MLVCVPGPGRGSLVTPTLGGAALAVGRPRRAQRRRLASVWLGERELPPGSAAILQGWPSSCRGSSLPLALAGPARLLGVCVRGGAGGGRVRGKASSARREGGEGGACVRA